MAGGKGTLRVRIVGDASNLQKTLKRSSGMMSKFGKTALIGLGAAAAAGVAGSIKAFADFDAAMTKSLAIMGDVSDAMRSDMSDAAREVGKTTSFSAKQAADSYFFLASAGLDAKASVEALPKVASFAQAGMFDMATATDLATDAQSALGMTSDNTKENIKQLTRTTDVFVKANTLANASVEEFATSMTRKAGGALQSLDKDIEEGTAALAVFADQGIKGERAGTILTNTLDGLTEQSRKNAEEFKELGVDVFDAKGNMRNMADITADLEDGLAGMSTEQREAALAALGFNKRTREGILALVGNSDALREYEGELRNAGGTAKEVADKQLDTFWEQLGLLKDQVVDLGIDIGSKLVPHLMSFVEAVQDNMPLIEDTIGSLMDAFGALFGSTDEGSQRVKSSVQDMGLTSVDAISEWASDTESLSSDIRDSLESIKETIEDDLTPALESLSDWWNEDGKDMASTAKSTLGSIVGFLNSDWVPGWLTGLGLVSAKILGWKATAISAIGVVTGKLKGSGGAFGDWTLKVGQHLARWRDETLIPTFDIAGSVVLEFAKVKMGTFASTVGDKVGSVGDWFRELPDKISNALSNLKTMLFNIGLRAIDGLSGGLVSRLEGVLDTVRNIGSDILEAARDAFDVRSPSKEFEKIGLQVGAGLDAGILASLANMEARDQLDGLIPQGDGGRAMTADDRGGGSSQVIDRSVHVHGDVRPVDFDEFDRQMRQKQRVASLQGNRG